MPRISIILPFYNREQTLYRCVQSAVNQTFADWELVAVDDASTDQSSRLIAEFADPRIRVIRHDVNRGAGPARDTAMAAATGEFFAFLDSDDEWLPEKLEAQRTAIDASGQGLSCCRYEFIRDGKTIIWPKPFDPTCWERSLHRECTFGFGTTLLIRRSLAEKLGPFDPELVRHEDWDWVLRALVSGEKIAFVDRVLARVHAGGRPPLKPFIHSTDAFLAKHKSTFARFGEKHRRKVVGYHYESVASMAYDQGAYTIGHRSLLRSYLAWPWRSPLPLLAIPVATIDSIAGTRLLEMITKARRRLIGKHLDQKVA